MMGILMHIYHIDHIQLAYIDLYDLIFGFMRKLDMFPSIQWFIM